MKEQLKVFLVKSATIAVAAYFVLMAVVDVAIKRIDYTIRRNIQFTSQITDAIMPGAGQLGNNLQKMANNIQSMTPSRRKELLSALRVLARELEPFAAELRPLVYGPPPEQPPRNP